ncbi:MAG: hypothetical protein EPN85_04180, partial [Bacteroidetes bacterium]
MKKNVFIFLSVLCSVWPATLFAQSRWTANPFGQKVFVENKGQFSNMDNGGGVTFNDNTSTILFGANSDGVDLYFTINGLTYRHNELVQLTEEEQLADGSPRLEKKEKEEEKRMMKHIPHYLSVEWLGSNPNAEIIAEEPVSFYYTYGGAGRDTNTTLKASACRKIIYKNLYPDIDVEYVFPKDSSGIKYSLILRPGANPAAIKMKYTGAEKLFLNDDGNMMIKSSFGEFMDHAPKTFYKDSGKPIASSFSINNNIISFSLPTPNSSPLTVIIDPWTTNPNFSFNSAYDVNYDQYGNVYIYGSFSDIVLAKLNNAGAIQWIFSSPSFGSNNYGDFAVDEVSGTSYLGEGVGFGARILKVNTSGLQTGTGAVGANMEEISRMEYNRCINKIVVAGGGSSTYMAAMLDTDLVSMTPVNVLSATSGWHDISLLAIDNSSSFCYMASSYNFATPTSDNFLIKCPVPGLVPLSFSVPDGHKFGELRSVMYFKGPANGINGMAVSPNWLYTYDSDSLKRWDKNTGALIAKIDISPLSPSYYTGSGTPAIKVLWGGLSVDACDNIYVGLFNSIKEYNSSLSLINTFTLPDTVYDVKIGINNKLYACGKGFVTEIDIPPGTISTTIILTQTPASGCSSCNGTATVSSISTACDGTLSGSGYSWNTSPVQTTQIATGLCPGNYAVTVITGTTNCLKGFIATSTVTITNGSGALLSNVTAIPAACGNNNGSATVTVTTGTPPYTYSWSPAGGTNAAASGLSTGAYTVSITDATGCIGTNTIAVTTSSNVTATASPNSTICAGQMATLTATGGGNYSWSNGNINSTINVSPTSTATYSVIVSVGTCSDTAYATVTIIPGITATAGTNSTICVGQTVTLSASGGNNYSWNNGSTTSAINVSPSATTNYSVAVSNGSCSGAAVVTVVISPPPVASVPGITICSGQTATLTASGGGNYSWSNGNTNSSISISPTTNTTYSVVVSIGICADTTSATVIVNASPSVSVAGNTALCTGDIATLTASGSNNYSWSNGSAATTITVTPSSTATYTVATSNGSCTSAASITVIVSSPPMASVSGAIICDGETATLIASGGANYIWSNGQTTNPITVSPAINTTYSVIVSIGNCTDTASATITVNPIPIAAVSGNVTITTGSSATLSASGGGNYGWSNGSTINPIVVSPAITTGYCVTVSNGNCTDNICVTVFVEPMDCST